MTTEGEHLRTSPAQLPEIELVFPRERPMVGPRLRAAVSSPHPEALVVTIVGDVDAATVEQVREALLPSLLATVRVIVVDLTQVHFLGVPGLQLLTCAYMLGQSRGVEVRLVATDRETRHAVHMAGVDALVNCYGTVAAALPSEP